MNYKNIKRIKTGQFENFESHLLKKFSKQKGFPWNLSRRMFPGLVTSSRQTLLIEPKC